MGEDGLGGMGSKTQQCMAVIKIKQVKLRLIGIDGNAFSVLGAFRRQAKRENWTSEEIDAVCDEAQTENYAHLLVTIMKYCIGGGA